ncbi:MAG: glutamate formimidoyltransferase [Pelolinea sp.]|nr:glutamate formimidoyltransferase [Pelolinea sp.]
MYRKIIECIPNFSEGRDQHVVDSILEVFNAFSSIQVLDHHSDKDHNRTVVTILGSPEEVEEAVFQVIKKAGELIDMDKHEGAHPRIGATDVVPFVPIQNMGVQECVEMAVRIGDRVGNELNIPVYLYEEAARIPERKNLEFVRKGQYEGLKEEIRTDPTRKPDFGPSELGKAGATVIGAREALIAFNVYLATEDTAIAKKIAKTIRFSSGGLRFVKAMGVLVDGQAQVSMNLTNFNKTAIPQVMEMIRIEAKRYGTVVHHSELVGLIPQKALIDSAIWYLQLDQFLDDQILERKLDHAGSVSESKQGFEFLDDLASQEPTPGGGSAAAFTAAEAAALTAMVGRVTLGKKKYADVHKEMEGLVHQADELRQSLSNLITEDSAAFEQVMQAYKLPKETAEQDYTRGTAIQAATLKAAETPLETCQEALKVLRLAGVAAEKGNKNAITDAGTASLLAIAAISSAGANVRINLQSLSDEDIRTNISDQLEKIEIETRKLDKQIRSQLKTRSQIELL